MLTFAFCIKVVGPNAIVVESLSTSDYFVGEVGRNKFVAMHPRSMHDDRHLPSGQVLKIPTPNGPIAK